MRAEPEVPGLQEEAAASTAVVEKEWVAVAAGDPWTKSGPSSPPTLPIAMRAAAAHLAARGWLSAGDSAHGGRLEVHLEITGSIVSRRG